MQHLTAIAMCKIGRTLEQHEGCWHIFPTLQILPHVITGCLYMWKNIFSVDSLNRKTISTLLSLPLNTAWARTTTELQLIIYHTDGKSVLTVLVIILTWGHTCKHSAISVVLLSCTGIPRFTRSHFTRFRYNAISGKKAVRKLYSNFQSPCTLVAWIWSARTSWSHFSSTYQCKRKCWAS
jgi:hypothetical protein